MFSVMLRDTPRCVGTGVWGVCEGACVPYILQSCWAVTSAPADSHHAPHPFGHHSKAQPSASQSRRMALWLGPGLDQPATY